RAAGRGAGRHPDHARGADHLVRARRAPHDHTPRGGRRPPRNLSRPHPPPRTPRAGRDRPASGHAAPGGPRMTSTAQARPRPLAPVEGRATSVRQRLADYVELTKPRIVAMVLVATLVGYYLGCPGLPQLVALLHTLVGTALAAAGTLTLNQVMECERDARMERTRRRPLPEGRIAMADALVFGVALLALGLTWLALGANVLSAILTATITVTYLFLYTP